MPQTMESREGAKDAKQKQAFARPLFLWSNVREKLDRFASSFGVQGFQERLEALSAEFLSTEIEFREP